MSDIRSLLKQARQTKRITHPYAKYSSSGTLYCTACTLKIPSEAIWDTHIASTQHKENVKKVIQEGQRKAKRGIAATAMAEEEQEVEQERKRLKVEQQVAKVEEEIEEDEEESAEEGLPADFFDPGMKPQTTGVDENEWAKFQEEIAETIRNQEEEGKDVEEDIEELQRGIVDEFDELNTLEDRVERLKRRREELKAKDVQPMNVVETNAEEEEEEDAEEEEEWW